MPYNIKSIPEDYRIKTNKISFTKSMILSALCLLKSFNNTISILFF